MKKNTIARKRLGGEWRVVNYKPEITIEQLREKHPENEYQKARVPSMATLERWSEDGICEAMDGCRVEPDGTCAHGYPSWLLAIGMI